MQPQYLRNELYQENSPVFHVGSYMKKTLDANDHVSERLLSLVFKNISNRKIIAYQGVIHNYSSFNEKLDEIPFTTIEISNFEPGNLFGEKIFFKVNPNAVFFKVILKRITFEGFETENLEFESYENIISNTEVHNIKKKEYIMNKFNREFDYIRDLEIHDTFYHCVCGALNQICNAKCINCKAPKETYIKIFNEKKIEEEIEYDAKSYLENLFAKTDLDFDLSDANIEYLLKSFGLNFILKQIREERDNYQRLNSVIIEKLKQSIPSAQPFNDLIERFEILQNEINKRKEKELLRQKEIEENKKRLERESFNQKKESVINNLLDKLTRKDFKNAKLILENSKSYFSVEEKNKYSFLINTESKSIEKLFQTVLKSKKTQQKFINDYRYTIASMYNILNPNERKLYNDIFYAVKKSNNAYIKKSQKRIIALDRTIALFVFLGIFSMFPLIAAAIKDPEEDVNVNLVLFFIFLLLSSIFIVVVSITVKENIKEELKNKTKI